MTHKFSAGHPVAATSTDAAYGTPGDFACAICERDSTGPAVAIRTAAMPPNLSVAVCPACAVPWRRSAAYREQHAETVVEALQRALTIQVADRLGADPDVISSAKTIAEVDATLGLPAGSFEAAMEAVLKEAKR